MSTKALGTTGLPVRRIRQSTRCQQRKQSKLPVWLLSDGNRNQAAQHTRLGPAGSGARSSSPGGWGDIKHGAAGRLGRGTLETTCACVTGGTPEYAHWGRCSVAPAGRDGVYRQHAGVARSGARTPRAHTVAQAEDAVAPRRGSRVCKCEALPPPSPCSQPGPSSLAPRRGRPRRVGKERVRRLSGVGGGGWGRGEGRVEARSRRQTRARRSGDQRVACFACATSSCVTRAVRSLTTSRSRLTVPCPTSG